MKNKLSKILLLSNIYLITGCNSGATTQEAPVASVNELKTIRDNEVSFNAKNILPYNEKYFDLESYVVNDDDWKGISQTNSTNDGITVQAGRTANSGNYKWLNNYSYISSGNLRRHSMDHNFYASKYNFGIRGKFKFNYKPNATAYICNDIAMSQFNLYNNANVWEFYSNISPHTSASNDNDWLHNVIINCVNQKNNKLEKFNIIAKDTHFFDVQLYSEAIESTGVLSVAQVTQQIIDTYNSIPMTQRLPIYSNDIYNLAQYKPSDFLVYNAGRLNVAFEPVSAIQDGDLVITKDTQPIYVGTNTVVNCSNVQQTAQTASYSKSITNSITTTAINTLGGEFGLEYSGPLMVTGGKISAKVNYSHSWQNSKTDTQTDTFMASPQPVLLAPLSKQAVTIKLDQLHLNGEYKFRAATSGTMMADGVVFRKNLAPLVFDNDKKGVLDIYDVLSKSNKPLEQIEIDRTTKKVYFIGKGKIDGSVAGSELHVEYGKQLPLTPEDISKCESSGLSILLLREDQ